MFIAKAIANQSKLRRSETKDAIYLALLRSWARKQTGIYKINISSLRDSFFQETCSKNKKSAFPTQRARIDFAVLAGKALLTVFSWTDGISKRRGPKSL